MSEVVDTYWSFRDPYCYMSIPGLLSLGGDADVVIALAGNKVDREEDREVPTDEAKQYADECGLHYMETSAKTNVNIRELFLAIAKKLPKESSDAPKGGLILDEDDYEDDKPAKKGCCSLM